MNAFLKGGGALTTGSAKKKVKEWIPDAVWLNITVMSETDAFRDLPDAIARADAAWRHWYDAEAPERAPVPAIEDHLSKFQRMCVVRVSFTFSTRLEMAHRLIVGHRDASKIPEVHVLHTESQCKSYLQGNCR